MNISTGHSIAFAIACIAALALVKPLPARTYAVSNTFEKWNSSLKVISDAKEIMRKSSYPGTIIASVTDSLDVLAKEISEQVGAELQREAAKPKADSSHKPVTNK